MTKIRSIDDDLSRLLTPITVGKHVLRNRLLMGSMHTRLEYLDQPAKRQAAFYAERARGGAALIVTAGFSPNLEGCLEEGSNRLDSESGALAQREITAAVHHHDCKILLQILHAGRYARHELCVAPSAVPSPLSKRTPRALSDQDIDQTIRDFVRCAELAKLAGYDGVELMGSEGYLLNQFATPMTNRRDDRWGGTLAGRCHFALEIIRRIRASLGAEFLLFYRISALDLVGEGMTGTDIDYLAKSVEAAGVDALSTGVGWHESRVPTIAYHVPRGAFRFATARLKRVVSIPVVASNRINTPQLAEEVLAAGEADLVSLARPMLADPQFARKVREHRTDEINTCIACNQACLDYIFTGRAASCLVNPRAGHELDLNPTPALAPRRIAVVGAGAAGMACAISAASRGHQVVLFEASNQLGGQLNLASRIPGKQEFLELLRYFRRQLELHRVELRLTTPADVATVADFDHVVVATGVQPRTPQIDGIDHPTVASYQEIITGERRAGARVAIIGSGGIGFDVAELLLSERSIGTAADFCEEWGVDTSLTRPGALMAPRTPPIIRRVTMFQRSADRPGMRLGRSTGWILREKLARHGLCFETGVRYGHIDDDGLHYFSDGHHRTLPADLIVTCAGQEPSANLATHLADTPHRVSIIGGARLATELDATRAIDEGTRLGYEL